MRLLVLVTDAYGARGGIAKFNRDLLQALCAHPSCEGVVVLPRTRGPDELGTLPERLAYRTGSTSSKAAFFGQTLRTLAFDGHFDGVLCGHIHLLPLAALAARVKRAPLLLVLHGIDAWGPTRKRLANRLVGTVDVLVAVSELTRRRFLAWANVRGARAFVIPNCVDVSAFGAGPKPAHLLERYRLHGKEVIMTLARLPGRERHKGVDEVLELMPELARERPRLMYLVAGDGDDRSRLEAKAAALGVRDRVVFSGYVSELEKADHYRLADAFVMPGRGEGFGVVYLEAMACGIPVVASSADASSEAVRQGALGLVVDPDDPESIRAGVLAALARIERAVPNGLDYFSQERFTERWHDLVGDIFAATPRTHRPLSFDREPLVPNA